MTKTKESAPTLTRGQKNVLLAIFRASGRWYRAAAHGERVTLANLHRKGLLERRPRRGVEGTADAAYEYRLTAEVYIALRAAGFTPAHADRRLRQLAAPTPAPAPAPAIPVRPLPLAGVRAMFDAIDGAREAEEEARIRAEDKTE